MVRKSTSFFFHTTQFFCLIYFSEHLSKRLTLKDKYKIEKKRRQYFKKLRRDAKKNPKRKPSIFQPLKFVYNYIGLRDDLGIPSSAPFKEEIAVQLKKEKEDDKKERIAMSRPKSDMIINNQGDGLTKRKRSKSSQQNDIKFNFTICRHFNILGFTILVFF